MWRLKKDTAGKSKLLSLGKLHTRILHIIYYEQVKKLVEVNGVDRNKDEHILLFQNSYSRENAEEFKFQT